MTTFLDKKLRKFFLSFLFLFVFLPTTDGLAEPQLTKLVVVLDWLANANHAPILVAQQQGFFKKQGLDVNVIAPADPTDPPKWVAMGRADLAIDYQPRVAMEISQGLPIKQVGTLIDHPLNCLVVLAKSPITKPADLKGQTIAYSSPQIDLFMLTKLLAQVGLSIDQVKPVNVHYGLMQALLSGQAQAAIGVMRNVELVELQLLGHKMRTFFPENYGIPSYSELVFIGKKNEFDSRYERFFKALNEANQYLQAHPLEAYAQIILVHPELNSPANKAMWLKTLTQFSADFSRVDQQQYNKVKAFF